MEMFFINFRKVFINLEIHSLSYWRNYIRKGDHKYPYYGYFVVPKIKDDNSKRLVLCTFPILIRILYKGKK